MQNKIIQRNCLVLKANFEETLWLLKDYEAAALCLQETHLRDTDSVSIRNYSAFHTFLQTIRGSLVVSLSFVNNNALHSHVPLHINLQAVAVSITLHRVITLCSIYIFLLVRDYLPKSLKIWIHNYFYLSYYWETLMVIISFGVPKI